MLSSSIAKFINGPTFDSSLRNRILEWCQSPLFTKFLNQNEQKILKKLENAREEEDKRDIGVELYVAFIFSDASCEVIYEPDVDVKKKPDFTISFESYSFYCEVKRIRKWVIGTISNEEMYKKCGDIICEKIVQTVPESINIVYVRQSGFGPVLWDLENAIKNLFEWMEKDPKIFLKKIQTYSMNSIDEFKKFWTQCSAIVIPKPQNGRFIPTVWDNPKAAVGLSPVIKSKIEEAIIKPFRNDPLFDE